MFLLASLPYDPYVYYPVISTYMWSNYSILPLPFLTPKKRIVFVIFISSIICGMNLLPLNIFVYALCSAILICFLHVEASDFSAKNASS